MTSPAAKEDQETVELLRRWHGGDRDALGELLDRELPWLSDRISKRLGEHLRRRGETVDYLQDAMLDVLRYTPRFTVQGRAQFRGLLARIAENVLRDQNDFFAARRRALDREQPLPADTVLTLDPSARGVTRPSEAAALNEEEAWLRLAMELLDPEDREVIVLRQWDGLSFADVGRRLGIAEDAARMRFQRALPRLSARVEALRRGEID